MDCILCGEEINMDGWNGLTYGDEGSDYAGKPLHERCCDEAEPCATVYFNGGEEPEVISSTRNYTGGVFTLGYVHTDGWRGYYVVKSKVYASAHDDCILHGSEDAEELEKFDGLLTTILKEREIKFARVSCSTSNVFSSTYELWVEKTRIKEAKALAKLLAKTYRDETRFLTTAVFGGIPEDERKVALSELIVRKTLAVAKNG